jgi:hypothetical protein
MEKPRYVLGLLAALVLVGAMPLADAQPVGPSTGLNFAPREQYEGIPLASNPYSGTELPSSVDLSRSLPPPGNQGNQNSCVGWAVAYALKSYHEQRELNWMLEAGSGNPHPDRVFSPSFIYNQINNGQDGGADFVRAFNVLSEQGAAPLSAMPYTSYNSQIPESARQAARQYRIDTWRRVNIQDTRELKAQLNAGFPIVIGAQVDEGFHRSGANQIWRQQVGQTLGGHAMLVVGYDDARNAFRVINSWGRQWGDGGYGWIDYGYFGRVVREAFVVQDARNGPGPAPPVNPMRPDVPDYVPPPPQGSGATLVVQQFMHNQMHPQFGVGAWIGGVLSVPPGARGQAQIVIVISYQNGQPVAALTPQFAMPTGQAATGTPPLPLNGAPITNLTWQAFLPYCALGVPKGQICLPYPQGPPQLSYLMARSTLYIDNFGVAEGQPIPFQLAL